MSEKPYKQYYKELYVIQEAIEELMVFDLLKTFPAHMFKQIRWTKPIKTEDFEKDRQIMLEDLITKRPNSLVKEV
jgi:hypothetical protein